MIIISLIRNACCEHWINKQQLVYAGHAPSADRPVQGGLPAPVQRPHELLHVAGRCLGGLETDEAGDHTGAPGTGGAVQGRVSLVVAGGEEAGVAVVDRLGAVDEVVVVAGVRGDDVE